MKQHARRLRGLQRHLTSTTGTKAPVALVLGAGAGTGQAVAAKFAAEGYHVAPVRRGP